MLYKQHPCQKTDRKNLSTRNLKPLKKGADGAQFYADSPQKKFAEMAKSYLAKNQEEPFEKKVCYLLYELKKNELGLDPILQCRLFKRIVDIGSNSTILDKKLSKYSSDLTFTESLDLQNYINPSDKEADVVRQDVRSKMGKIRSPGDVFLEIKPELDKMMNPVTIPRLFWVAAALKDRRGDWEFCKSSSEVASGSGKLLVWRNQQLIQVGTMESGEIKLAEMKGLYEGLPIFMQENVVKDQETDGSQ